MTVMVIISSTLINGWSLHLDLDDSTADRLMSEVLDRKQMFDLTTVVLIVRKPGPQILTIVYEMSRGGVVLPAFRRLPI